LTAASQADAALASGNYAVAISLYNALLSQGTNDAQALLGLAKAYYRKTPSEPDIAREYLARVFQSAATDSPEGKEALSLLSEIGLPENAFASPSPGTPGTSGPTTVTPVGSSTVPAGLGAPGPSTADTGATAGPATTAAGAATPAAPGTVAPSTAAPATTP
jgi:hypothetical protein